MKRKKGMTLIEVTFVIAVLLGLTSVLFIGIAAYKKSTETQSPRVEETNKAGQ